MVSIFSQQTNDMIERELNEYFKVAAVRARKIDPSYERLWHHLHDLISSGGKRFRPNMTVLAYELFGGTDLPSIIPIAAAQELLHFSLLIHDDIIDRDCLRYGVPNMTGRYKAFYQKHVAHESELVHFAESAAVLAGDLMLAGAYELIMESGVGPEEKSIAHRLLSRSVFDVAAGELLDTEASILPTQPGGALKISIYKTARYSFVVPLVTGARLAGLPEDKEAPLSEYAQALGIAYQLVDDLLGVFGREEETGKPNSGDIREGKRTFLAEHAMQAMNTEDKILFGNAFGNPDATPEAIHQAKSLLETSGGREKTEQAIRHYHDKALAAATRLDLDQAGLEKLTRLADLVTMRAA